MPMQRVVVTGYGAITPIGNNTKDFQQNLFLGISGAKPITKFDCSQFKTQIACEVKNYHAEDYFDKRTINKLDLFAQYGLIATDEALNMSNLLTSSNINNDRIGVIWASGVGGVNTFYEETIKFNQANNNPAYFSPFFVPKKIIDSVAGNIAIKYGFKGINYGTVAACASSAYSIINAYTYLQLGKADVIIAGGSEAAINEVGIGSFNALRALSTNNDNPSTASRPFDKDRDGFVMGEGAGCLVLETLEHALQRNAPIFAEIVGYGMNADAYHITAPDENGVMVSKVMQSAIDDAKISIKDIDVINAHATSTMLGDLAEINAIEQCFGNLATSLNITAPKSIFGHLLGAAGAVELITSILMLQEQKVSPTINHFNLDEKLNKNLNYTFNILQPKNISFVLNNNFGFGGHNASILIKKNIK
ncbi:MAG: beta-ketoacyl-ACP synthase II [Chitinophagales bacterium]|nr:beta-ketoacyl-ACP synthase II [Chitinophagales bacterium]